jgi:glycogen synthase
LRILTLSNLYPPDVMGGYEIACAQVVDALRSRGHEVEVLAATPRRPVDRKPGVRRTLKLTEDRHWLHTAVKTEDALSLLRDVESRLISVHNVQALLDALQELAPDVVYAANLVGIGGLGLLACLDYLGVPWVWQLGDRIPVDLCTAQGRLVPALAKELANGSGRFVAVSQQLWESLANDGVPLFGRVDVAPYWITGDAPDLSQRRPRSGTLRIISVGRVHREKGSDILVEAAALLRASGRHDFRIDVYGEVGDPSIPPLIRQHDLSDHVTLHGPRPHAELVKLYGEYDVCAFPTREIEPFGLVPLEALSQGCVPVMTRRCGVAEWLVHGVHCLKSARNPLAFADVFSRILDGEVSLEALARRGSAAVWRDFHLDAILPRIEQTLREATERRRAASGTPADAFRLARLAECLAHSFVQESQCA